MAQLICREGSVDLLRILIYIFIFREISWVLAIWPQIRSTSPSWIRALTWRKGLCHSVKLRTMLWRASQDGWVLMKSSDLVHWRKKQQPTPVFLPRKPHGVYEKAKRYSTGRWASQIIRCQYATGEEQRAITNSSSKSDTAGPGWKWPSAVDVSGGESKVWCCKEQYCIGTWNVLSMSQGKLDVAKQEMARLNLKS